MKKVALTQRLIENETYFEIRETLDVNYAKLLKEMGFLPIVLPYKVPFSRYFESLNIEGVIFTGGNDLFICNQNELSLERDEYEMALLEYCIKNNIPIFGICRGMQLIAKYFNSTFKPIKDQIAIKHELHVNEKSLYAQYLKQLDKVNSYHSFSIDKLGHGLDISATDQNGVIKSIEHKDLKIFGQMWHSERNQPFSLPEMALIRSFFDD